MVMETADELWQSLKGGSERRRNLLFFQVCSLKSEEAVAVANLVLVCSTAAFLIRLSLTGEYPHLSQAIYAYTDAPHFFMSVK